MPCWERWDGMWETGARHLHLQHARQVLCWLCIETCCPTLLPTALNFASYDLLKRYVYDAGDK